jgi:hypothetical protein
MSEPTAIFVVDDPPSAAIKIADIRKARGLKVYSALSGYKNST